MSVVLNDESDAELDSKSDGTWIGVGDLFSVCIHRAKDGLMVDVYARGYEDCESIAACHAYADDARTMQQESEGG